MSQDSQFRVCGRRVAAMEIWLAGEGDRVKLGSRKWIALPVRRNMRKGVAFHATRHGEAEIAKLGLSHSVLDGKRYFANWIRFGLSDPAPAHADCRRTSDRLLSGSQGLPGRLPPHNAFHGQNHAQTALAAQHPAFKMEMTLGANGCAHRVPNALH